MKFGEHLGSHLTPEWRTQYVQYDEMKKYIYAAAEDSCVTDSASEAALKRHFAQYDPDFFNFCDKELQKINTFFAEKLAEASRRFTELEFEISNAGVERLDEIRKKSVLSTEHVIHRDINDLPDEGFLLAHKKRNIKTNKKKLSNMKFVVGEFYLSLVLIQNFQKLNFTGFRKILKKHDKVFKTTTGAEYRVANVETAPFNTNKVIDELITKTETIAIEDLESGNRSKAMKRLRVPPLSEKQKSGPHFFWGLFTGMWIVLIGILIFKIYIAEDVPFPSAKHIYNNSMKYISNMYNNSSTNYGNDINQKFWDPAIHMYRGFLIILIMIALLGINVYGWRQAGVNHVLIFELDPRHYLMATEFLMIGSFFGFLWSLSCLGFLIDGHVLPKFAHPGAFAIFLLLFFLNPTRTFWYRSRRWLLKVLFRIICAPFFPVKFADFWLADQLNSLVVPLRDFEYLICFYAYDLHNGNGVCTDPKKNFMRPFVALLPAWFRFAQCLRRYYDTRKAFPHLVNGCKYFTSIMVTVFSTVATVHDSKENYNSPLTIVWLVCLFISTLFSLTWDLRMDWGLFKSKSGENRFLREHIVYRYRTYYYLAIIGDILLRFLKPLTVSMNVSSFIKEELFIFFLGIFEAIRRFVWNFFRLENEHLNNCGEFRAVRDISIMPIKSSPAKPTSDENIKNGIRIFKDFVLVTP